MAETEIRWLDGQSRVVASFRMDGSPLKTHYQCRFISAGSNWVAFAGLKSIYYGSLAACLRACEEMEESA
jgi:hypothetical protein